jgi:hypothetical protein
MTLKGGSHTLGENHDNELYGGTGSPERQRVSFRKMGNRNAELTGYTDQDTGPNTVGEEVKPLSVAGAQAMIAAQLLRYQRMQADHMFDYSHPFDEYGPPGSPDAVVVSTFQIQPDYDMPERVEHIAYSVPVGTTFASVQLGQRLIVLYQGTALVTPLVGALFTGIILNATDNRIVTFTGATGTGYLGLAGFALTRGQFS